MMKERPIVSVVIPVFNASNYLSKCLESVLIQNITNYEIILIDDGSTDNSGHICDYYSNRYENVRTFHISNHGVSYARNFGLSNAKGKYLHFVDSDDILDSCMYEELVNIITYCEYDIIITGARYHNEIFKTVEEFHSKEIYDIKKHDYIKFFLLDIDEQDKGWAMNVIWNKWIKNEMVKKHDLSFCDNICPGEDFIFVIDSLKNAQSLFVSNKVYYNYFVRNNLSLLRKFYGNILEMRPLIYKKYIDLYDFFGILDICKNRIDLIEGKNFLKSLFSILNTNCKLTLKKKYVFVKRIIKSSHFKYVYLYLKDKNDISSKIFYILLKTNNTIIAFILIYAYNVRIKVMNKRNKKCL